MPLSLLRTLAVLTLLVPLIADAKGFVEPPINAVNEPRPPAPPSGASWTRSAAGPHTSPTV